MEEREIKKEKFLGEKRKKKEKKRKGGSRDEIRIFYNNCNCNYYKIKSQPLSYYETIGCTDLIKYGSSNVLVQLYFWTISIKCFGLENMGAT